MPDYAYKDAVYRAKKALRTDVLPDGWNIHNYVFDFPKISGNDNILRLDNPSIAEFENLVKKKYVPCLIQGSIDDWPARTEWTFEKLLARFSDQKFKVGEDDNGCTVKIKFKYFVKYMQENNDDSPMNIFDANYGGRCKIRRLLHETKPIKYFVPDFFKITDRRIIPPNRWLIVGPKRSGTNIHTDPLNTSAWNALIVGVKLWCLFPPYVPKEIVRPKLARSNNPDAAITWFSQVFSKFKEGSEFSMYPMTVCLQRAGDVMYVPSGWWHVVLNVEDTVAVTENFVDEYNFEKCLKKCIRSRPAFTSQWLKRMRSCYPAFMAQFNGKYDYLVTKFADNTSSSESSNSSSTDTESDVENPSPAKKQAREF